MVLFLLGTVLGMVMTQPYHEREQVLSRRCAEVPCKILKNCNTKCATLCIFKPANDKCKFKGESNTDRCIRYDNACRTPSLTLVPCKSTKQLVCKTINNYEW